MSDLKIKVGEKNYDIPRLTAGDWRRVIKAHKKISEKYGEVGNNLFEEEGLDVMINFYYALLNPTYPELTKNKLEGLDMSCLTTLFVAQVFNAITEIPLDSAQTKESESEGEKDAG